MVLGTFLVAKRTWRFQQPTNPAAHKNISHQIWMVRNIFIHSNMLIYAANMLYIVLYIVLLVIVIRAMFATTITIVMPDSMDAHEKIGRGTMSHHVAASDLRTFGTWQEPDVDWWLWFDCDTFFMNMTVPGSQGRDGSRHIAGIMGVVGSFCGRTEVPMVC
jgi:hypothetical protein